MNRHEAYEELAAGYALDALEPEDEQLFLEHLAGCSVCQAELGRHLETASALAAAAGPVDLPEDLLGRLRAAVVAESGPGAFSSRSGPVPGASSSTAASPVRPAAAAPGAAAPGAASPGAASPGAARRSRGSVRLPTAPGGTRRPGGRRWSGRAPALLAASAALVLLLGLLGDVLPFGGRDAQSVYGEQVAQALESLDAESGRTVPLRDDQERVAAVAVLHGDASVSLVAGGLPPNARDATTYVLWAVGADAGARALGAFDVEAGEVAVLRDLPLRSDAGELAALALTREEGDVAPAQPGQQPLAVGEVAA